MTTPFFNNAERIDRLSERAKLLLGTPWRANSSAPGVGISCHNVPRDLYIASGHFSESFPWLESTPASSTAENTMEVFLDGRREFARLRNPTGGTLTLLQPGDLLGLFVPINSVGKRLRHRCVNHLGVLLPENWFVHVLLGKNTDTDLINVPPWSQTLVTAWRPMER